MKPSSEGTQRDFLSIHRTLIPVLLFCCSLWLMGCSGSMPNPSPTANASSRITDNASLLSAPAGIDFGTVFTNSQPITRNVTLTNNRSMQTIAKLVGVTPLTTFAVQLPNASFTLNPGQSTNLKVTFIPRSKGAYSGSVILIASETSPRQSSSPSRASRSTQMQPVAWESVPGAYPLAVNSNRITILLSGNAVDRTTGGGSSANGSGRGNSGGGNNSGGTNNPQPSGGGSPQPKVAISISPTSVTLNPGESKQFSAAVTGTSNTSVVWTAQFGTISASGLYTAPNAGNRMADTVSASSLADPTQSARASLLVNSGTGVFTLKNQEPITFQQYQGSIFTTPLPANAENHCLSDVPCTASSPDKAVVNCMFGGNCSSGTGGSERNASFQRIAYDPADASGGGTGATATYYCDSSCPIYKIISLANQNIPSANNPLNQYFHLPNQALFGNAVGGDNYLFVWDQSTDGSAGNTVPGGRRFTDYEFSPAGLKTLPPCVCITQNCADVTASCQLSMNYADYSYPLNDSSAIGEGEAYVSVGAASQVGLIRSNELAAGVINHAIWLGASCEAAGAVFPSLGGQALTCDSQTNRPHAGALFKISSSFNCSAVNPQELRAVCVAMQTYGGYLSDTSGPSAGNGATLLPNRIEGGVAYAYLGAPSPALQQMGGDANGTTLQCSSKQINATPASCSAQFFNLSGLVTGNNLEIIDPCVALAMAGKPGGCSQ